MAGKYEISVFLDMHQDLFSCKYGDGAPEWATLTDNQEHTQTGLWSEAYLLSNAVQTAFDNFWNNKKAADGLGVQDHYINMWKHIASRYRDNNAVIGYDIINEPFIGSGVNDILPIFLKVIGEAAFKNEKADNEMLIAHWLDPVKKMDLMNLLSDKELFQNLMRKGEKISQHFEKTHLNDFYNKVGKTIREKDKHAILFLEANYFSNAGMMSGIRPIKYDDRIQDKYQAFSPHVYDFLVDTDMYEQSCNARVDVIFETHKRVQDNLNLPMLIGE